MLRITTIAASARNSHSPSTSTSLITTASIFSSARFLLSHKIYCFLLAGGESVRVPAVSQAIAAPKAERQRAIICSSGTLRIRQLNSLYRAIERSISPFRASPYRLGLIFMNFRGPQALVDKLRRDRKRCCGKFFGCLGNKKGPRLRGVGGERAVPVVHQVCAPSLRLGLPDRRGPSSNEPHATRLRDISQCKRHPTTKR
jgi:hypothetical protein